ncbi:four helix bundle protein [uncultured Draconibacterium sp.]|uniref:four helix bundle protein n=1 Tax=uncultured Draconibacterium sp. TaxID=1573823 RepID=UPI00321724AF
MKKDTEEISFLTLDKISAYNKSFQFSNEVWEVVLKWEFFAKDTVGKQLVRSADSVSANIAEGFGRYGKKDKIRFYRIGLGSLEEAKDWIYKSSVRNLISEQVRLKMIETISEVRKEIFFLIKYTNEKLKF